jgi:hypothetical protein
MVLRTVYLTPEIDDELRVGAFKAGRTKNDLIRDAIKLYLKTAVKKKARPGVRLTNVAKPKLPGAPKVKKEAAIKKVDLKVKAAAPKPKAAAKVAKAV